jgi:phosphoglycolate phosphatase
LISRIKLVVLDYDLTLLNNIADFYTAFTDALYRVVGRRISLGVFCKYFLEDRLSELIPKDIDLRRFWIMMRKNICRSRSLVLREGARFFLELLNTYNIRCVIVSGKECHPRYIETELEMLGIDDYIEQIYTFYQLDVLNGVEEELFDKSWLLKQVINNYKIEPEEVVYIGDYQMDYISSLKAGINFIGLASYEHRFKKFRELGVKHIARSFYEAARMIFEI